MPAIARLLTVGALLLVVVWVVGHTLTDKSIWSQYLWWLPTLFVLAAAWPMVVVAAILERLSTRLAAFRLRVVTGAALFAITLFALFGEWHVHRYLIPPRNGQVRVVYWNLSVDRETEGAPQSVLAESPDIAVIANPRNDRYRAPFFEALGTLGGLSDAPMDEQPEADEPAEDESASTDGELDTGDQDGVLALAPADTHFLFRAEIAVATKGNITRYGLAQFDLSTKAPEDRGVVMFVEIAGLSDEPMVMWVVDLPSSPLQSRSAITALARSSVDRWNGPIFVLDSIGRWAPDGESASFPMPDIIVGDFNTPRGSHSIQTLTTLPGRTYRESFRAVGRGLGATWPRKNPYLGIDLLFADESIAIDRYRTKNPGVGHHSMLIVDITPP